MNGGEPSVWSVVSVAAPDLARTERGPAAVQHAEWVRLFLGRALAPSRLVGPEHAPSAVEYLVSGIDVSGNSRRDDAACIEAAHAVATDFEGLRAVIGEHRRRIEHCNQNLSDTPLELFLTTYPMLMCVTVSDDPADWRVTDQGLCIVRWGLRGPRQRPLLQWSADELQALQHRVIAAAGLVDVAPGDASYGRVAREAWRVLWDDEQQQRVQKAGDGPKKSVGDSQVASGARELDRPTPVPRRSAWLAWAETGLVVFALAAAGAGWWFDHRRLTDDYKILNERYGELELKLSDAVTKEAAAKAEFEKCQKQFNDCTNASNAKAPELAQAQMDANLLGKRVVDLERERGEIRDQLTRVTRDRDSALTAKQRLEDELKKLKEQLPTAHRSGEGAVEKPVTVAGEPKSPETGSATGGVPKAETSSVPGQVAPKPNSPKDSKPGSGVEANGGSGADEPAGSTGREESAGTSGGASGGTSNPNGATPAENAGGTANPPASAPGAVSGQADPLGSLLQDLCKLYLSAPSFKREDFERRLSTAGNGLDKSQFENLAQRASATNLELVTKYRQQEGIPQLSLQGTAELDLAFSSEITARVAEFLKNNALIKFAPKDRPLLVDGQIKEDGWHWISLGKVEGVENVDKSLESLRSRLKSLPSTQLPPPAGSRNQPDKWYRFVENLAVYYHGTRASIGNGQMFAFQGNDGVSKFEDPQQTSVLVWPLRSGQGRDKAKPTLDDLVKLLRSVANKYVSDQAGLEGKASMADVRIPIYVAWEFANSTLSKCSQYCQTVSVKLWLGQLEAVLQKQRNGAQPYVENMKDFKALLDRPPYFPAGQTNADAMTFYGALSVSGGDVKVVVSSGVADGKRNGHLAALDGRQFKHIGYLEEGKQTFDPGKFEDLLGCAVFVVQPPKAKKN